MSYKSLVESNLDLAFRLVGDLAYDMTLTPKQASAYDFSTGLTSVQSTTPITIRGIVEQRDSNGMGVILKNKDVPSPDLYDTITFGGKTYSFGDSFVSDGYTLSVQIYEE